MRPSKTLVSGIGWSRSSWGFMADAPRSLEHRVRQEQRDLRKGDEQRDAYDHRHPERQYPGEDSVHGHVLGDALHDEHVDAHRRTDKAHLEHDHHEDPEPDGI